MVIRIAEGARSSFCCLPLPFLPSGEVPPHSDVLIAVITSCHLPPSDLNWRVFAASD